MKQIVSYGGGTQSTAMILMALNGEFGLERPDFGVYADTGCEPQFINDYVDYFIDLVKNRYDFTIYKTMHKEGLEKHLLSVPTQPRKGNFYTCSVPPFYTLDEDGTTGMLMRQCTSNYKTDPITKFINSKTDRGELYRVWIGMSFDERERMRISTQKRRTNYYPLVDNHVHRQASIDYIKSHGLRSPMRSSCYFCPFHSNQYWEWMKKYHPSEFSRAIKFEEIVQANAKQQGAIKSIPFLHRSCKPIDQVQFSDPDQLNLFPHLIDECAGECGI